MSPEWLLKYLLPGDFIVMGFVLLWSWFLYKNFAKKLFIKMDEMVSNKNCLALRNQCAVIVAERRNHLKDVALVDASKLSDKLNFIEDKFEEKMKGIGIKIDSVLEIQKENQEIILRAFEKK